MGDASAMERQHDEGVLRARALRSAERMERPLEREALSFLPRHASDRRYIRVGGDEGPTEIAMLLPPAGVAGDEIGATASSTVADETFVRIGRWLEGEGVRVPEIRAIDESDRVIWLEDVGSVDFDAWVNAPPDGLLGTEHRIAGYARAVDLLLEMQTRLSVEDAPEVVRGRSFSAELLRWELDHFVEWRLEAQLGLSISAAQREALGEEFDALVAELVALPQIVVHRDLQSHNLMMHEDELIVLDFQDAVIGPAPYDAVALLRDSYVVLTPAELQVSLERWTSGFARLPAARGLSALELERAFHVQTVQRKLKDSGRFVFIERVKGNPGFLRFIEDSLAYAGSALSMLDERWRLRELLQSLDPQL